MTALGRKQTLAILEKSCARVGVGHQNLDLRTPNISLAKMLTDDYLPTTAVPIGRNRIT
jgi:hypothetical protein